MKLRRTVQATLACTLGLALTGCMSAPQGVALPEPRPLLAHYPASATMPEASTQENLAASPDVKGPLTLPRALELALLQNPELAAYSHEVRAADAEILQARLLPNPELGLGVEEYDRGGQGSRSAEGTVAVAQAFLLGGKRRWRTEMAASAGELAGWEYEAKRLDVFTETAQRFTDVIAAQRRLDLARSMVGLAEETSRATRERVNAGREPRLQASKAEAELEVARIRVIDTENGVEVARRKLAAMWGSAAPRFDQVTGDLDAVHGVLPSEEACRSRLGGNPDLARWDTELRLRRATLSSAKAQGVPDVTAAVGFHHYEEDGTDALSFGVGVPLPLFDRNQGNVAAEEHRLARTEARRRAAESSLSAEFAAFYAALASTHHRVLALRTRVVPSMEDAFDAAREGYRQGKFGFLDMLDAQRGLFEAQGALVDALADYHAAVNAIQRITGTRFDELITSTQEEQR